MRAGEGSAIKMGARKRVQIQTKPPKAGAMRPRPNPPNSEFRRFYERGDLPVRVEHRAGGNHIKWQVSPGTALCCHNPPRN